MRSITRVLFTASAILGFAVVYAEHPTPVSVETIIDPQEKKHLYKTMLEFWQRWLR